MNKKIFYSVYPGIIVFLAGIYLTLGWQQHYIRPLPSLASAVMPSLDPQENGIDIQAKSLSVQESKRLLGFDLRSKGIQPIEIVIQNNTSHVFLIAPTSVDMEHIDYEEVARKVRRSSFKKSLGFKILGFVFWPLIVPGTIDSIRTFHSKKKLTKEYRAKSMKQEVVPEYSTFNRILFVPVSEFKKDFTFSMIEQNRNQPWTIAVSAAEEQVITQTQELPSEISEETPS